MTRIALATYSKLPTLNDDDRLLVPALAALDVTAVPAVWDARAVCWDEFQGVLIRSCWDYHLRPGEFLDWIDQLERAGVAVWNPGNLLRWNHHKRYLRDLAARDVATVPTRWLPRGEAADLLALLADAGWREAVVKPAVSASAFGTWRTSTGTATGEQSRLDALLRIADVMVQPLLPDVADAGEWSLVFLGRRFSHAPLRGQRHQPPHAQLDRLFHQPALAITLGQRDGQRHDRSSFRGGVRFSRGRRHRYHEHHARKRDRTHP